MTTLPRVAVFGAGHWGRNLVRNFAELGALVAVVETDPGRRVAIAAEHPGVRIASDPDDVLGDDGIDGIVIATPAATHGLLVRRALEAGHHVFVEKPLCLDVDVARRLRILAASTQRVLMVGHLMLYHPGFRRLQALVAAGELGAIRYVYSNRLSLGQIRTEENALWSFAPHDISMILALVGAVPVEVVANGGQFVTPGVADTTISYLTFASGVRGHIFVSWLHPYKEQRLVVIGERGMAVFADTAAPGEKLMLYRHDVAYDGSVPIATKAPAEPVSFEDVEPLRNECATFLDAVETGLVPPSNADEGIRVLSVLDACQASLQSGVSVRLEERS